MGAPVPVMDGRTCQSRVSSQPSISAGHREDLEQGRFRDAGRTFVISSSRATSRGSKRAKSTDPCEQNLWTQRWSGEIPSASGTAVQPPFPIREGSGLAIIEPGSQRKIVGSAQQDFSASVVPLGEHKPNHQAANTPSSCLLLLPPWPVSTRPSGLITVSPMR